MEKRLRRARTAAIVLAVVFYLATKLAFAGIDGTFSHFMLPIAYYILEAVVGLIQGYYFTEPMIWIAMALGGLGTTALSATVAYAIHAMLRVDAD